MKIAEVGASSTRVEAECEHRREMGRQPVPQTTEFLHPDA